MTWSRVWGHSLAWGTQNLLVAHVPHGQTLKRVHFGWGMAGYTSTVCDSMFVANSMIAFGVQTVVSTRVPPPPSPVTGALDINPPLERWLWWETRAPQEITRTEEFPGVVSWRDSGPSQELDGQGQVLANVVGPTTLDVYLSWDTQVAWDASGQAAFWGWASVLYS